MNESTTETRFCPLAQLDLNGTDRFGIHEGDAGVEVKPAGESPRSEVAGAELENEVPAVAMVVADPTLAGVVEATCKLCATVQRLDRRAGQ